MPPTPFAPLFVIVRHGNTFAAGEPPRRIGARTDLPLTREGAAQAVSLGKHFAALGWRFARVLVSPLTRTQETALLIRQHQADAPPPEICDWLREIDHGPDENLPEADVLARLGAPALAAWDEHATPPQGWAIDGDARKKAWQALFAETHSGPVLIVTSNGAARFALMADPALAKAMPTLRSLKLPTGGYGAITRQHDETLGICVWGKRP